MTLVNNALLGLQTTICIKTSREKWQGKCLNAMRTWDDVFQCKHRCGAKPSRSFLHVCLTKKDYDHIVVIADHTSAALLFWYSASAVSLLWSLPHFAPTPMSALKVCSSFVVTQSTHDIQFLSNLMTVAYDCLTPIWEKRSKTSWWSFGLNRSMWTWLKVLLFFGTTLVVLTNPVKEGKAVGFSGVYVSIVERGEHV